MIAKRDLAVAATVAAYLAQKTPIAKLDLSVMVGQVYVFSALKIAIAPWDSHVLINCA